MRIVSGRETISLRISIGTALCEITDPHGAVAYREEANAQTPSDVQRFVTGCASVVASMREQRALDASYVAADPARQKRWAGLWLWCARRIRRWLTYAAPK
jgi:hypothetical protein